MDRVDWIGVDMGVRSLRVWAMHGDAPLHSAVSADKGAGLEASVLGLLGDWLPANRITPVIACGVSSGPGASGAARFRPVPCTPLGASLHPAPARDLRLALYLVPGLSQGRPADAAAGTETRIAGFLARHPGWDGVLCLPGALSRWVHLSAGEVVSFQTFLTGELGMLLTDHSILRPSVAGWDAGAFIDGIRAGMERPERLAARLFGLHAEALVAGSPPDGGQARLSGLLIGAELAAAKPYWLGQRVAVLGAAPVTEHYGAALADLAVPVSTHDEAEMTLAGLAQARTLIAPPRASGRMQ